MNRGCAWSKRIKRLREDYNGRAGSPHPMSKGDVIFFGESMS